MTAPDLRVGFPDHLDVLFLEGADRGHAKGKVDGVYPEFRNGRRIFSWAFTVG